MRRQTFALLIGVISLAVGIVLARFTDVLVSPAQVQPTAPERMQDWQVSDYRLSGPYIHENLTVFLIHGEEQIKGDPFLTLQEAMERKVVVVHETSDVNELAIENLSQKEDVFVQAGDIVKGGQQDRVLAVDLIVPPRSGRMPIDAFCVENGRWSQREAEPAVAFSTSTEMLATKDLKMAAKAERSQTRVWNRVAETQARLSARTDTNVRSTVSASSLQLTLENEQVRRSAEEYVKKLSSIAEGRDDVIGYVFAVNGTINSADVYASVALFRKLWPKLLRTTAVEAVAERTTNGNLPAVSADEIQAFFVAAAKGLESERDVTKRTKMIKREGEKVIFFETRDLAQGGAWIHRNYLAR